MSKNFALRKRIKEIFNNGLSDFPRPKVKSSRICSPCTPSYSPSYSPKPGKDLKINNLRSLIKEDLKKCSGRHSTYLSKDISHLQDKKINSFMSLPVLPTDLETLRKLKECGVSCDHTANKCKRESCINEAYLIKNRSLESNQSESLERLVAGSPTGRQEIIELSNWFHSMLAFHKNASIDSVMLIYEHCANEITKQVAVSCAERGELLGVLFKYQSDIHKRKLKEVEKETESQILDLQNKVKLTEQSRSVQEKETIERLEEMANKLSKVSSEKEKLEKRVFEASFKLNELTRKFLKEEQVWQKKNYYLMAKLKELYRPEKIGNHKTATVNWVSREENESKTEFKEIEDLYLSELEGKELMSLDEQTVDSDKYLYSYDRHLDKKIRSALKWNFSITKTENFSYTPKRKTLKISKENDFGVPVKTAKKELRRIARKKTKKKTTKNPYLIHIQSLENSPKPQIFFKQLSSDNITTPTLLSPDLLTVHSTEVNSENKDSEHDPFLQDCDFYSWKAGFEMGYEKGKNLADGESPANEDSEKINEEKDLNRAKSLRTVFQRKVKDLTVFTEFQFSHPGVKKQHPAYKFLTRLLVSDESWSKCTISRKTINKLITVNIQNSLLKHRTGEKIESFFEQVYDDFYQKYGLKGMCEKRFSEFLSSLFGYIEYKRVSIFIRLLGIAGKTGLENYSKRAFWYYLDCLDYMMSSKIGVLLAFDETADKQMFPSIRAIMCVRDKTEWFAGSEEVNSLVNKVLSESEEDLRGVNPHGLIELEALLSTIIELYETYVRDVEKGVCILAEAFGLEEASGYHVVLWCRYIHEDRFSCEESIWNLSYYFTSNKYYSLFEVTSKCIENRLLKASNIENFSVFQNESNEELGELHERTKSKYFGVKEEIESSVEEQIISEVSQFFELVSRCFSNTRAPNLNSIALQILDLEFNRYLKIINCTES